MGTGDDDKRRKTRGAESTPSPKEKEGNVLVPTYAAQAGPHEKRLGPRCLANTLLGSCDLTIQ